MSNKDVWENFCVKPIPLKGNGLFAKVHFSKDERLFQFTGTVLPIGVANLEALQVNKNHALESDNKVDDNLNHSCDPNCRILFEEDKVFLVSLRDIQAGEELSFDYHTTEYDLVVQGCAFECACCSPNCYGEIRGYNHLAPEDKIRMKDRLAAPYLRELAA